mmetsp:Transcript_79212/g.232587  ORF Transcript_79212/g.232587 Transcript_79212/m.232587 type:complete len:474 (+) Transcript_79212:47-1468(+)
MSPRLPLNEAGSPKIGPLKVSHLAGVSGNAARSKTHHRLLHIKNDGSFSPQKKALFREEPPRPPRLSELRERARSWAEARWLKLREAFPMLVGHMEFLVSGVDFAVRSVAWFRFGVVAVWLGFRLIVYSLMLLPAFLQIVAAYYHDRRILRGVRFGPNQRNYVDIYCPQEAVAAQQGKGEKVPVVIAVMGGAWVMGHRAWNAQLGLRLMDFGVLVFAVDYRNFPFGRVPEMVEDVGRAVGWVFENAEAYGGDTSNMMLLAQSAGAHLSSLLLLERSFLEASERKKEEDSGEEVEHTTSTHLDNGWSVGSLKGFLGVSGPYDFVTLEPHLASRGIYSRILYSLTVDGDLAGCSPTRVLKMRDWRDAKATAAALLPPIYLFHGECDKSVPFWSTLDFAESLREVGFNRLTVDVRPGMTHTYPVIEGPMAGEDPQVEIALAFLLGEERAREVFKASPRSRMWPQIFLDIAKHIMPY